MKNQIIKSFSIGTALSFFAMTASSQQMALNISPDSLNLTSMDEAAVPKEVKDAFNRQYPSTTDETWSTVPVKGNTNEWFDDTFNSDADGKSNDKDDESNVFGNNLNDKSGEYGNNKDDKSEAIWTKNKDDKSDDIGNNSDANSNRYGDNKDDKSDAIGNNSDANSNRYGNDKDDKSDAIGSNSDENSNRYGNDNDDKSNVFGNNSNDQKYFVAEFMDHETEHKSIYQTDGTHVATHMESSQDVPQPVSDAIAKSSYKTWEMSDETIEIFKDSQTDDMKVYKVEVANNNEKHSLFYQADGKLLKDRKVK